uniref:Uncharacterized protein n=1 Tax=Glossina pallidipes TaxID=7398 RepID=A0A1B0A5X4_GLOPL
MHHMKAHQKQSSASSHPAPCNFVTYISLLTAFPKFTITLFTAYFLNYCGDYSATANSLDPKVFSCQQLKLCASKQLAMKLLKRGLFHNSNNLYS